MRSARLALALLVTLGLGEVVSCKKGDLGTWPSDPPPAPCEDGECLPGTPGTPSAWKGPVWLWTGPEAEAPPCPEPASELVYEGHAGLQVTASCDACTCGPSACVLPTGLSVGTGGPNCVPPLKDVHAPEGWDGSCFAIPPIHNPTSVLYWGFSQAPCEPVAPVPEKHVTATWDTFARACATAADAEHCDDGAATCPAPAAEGFQQCVWRDGEHTACPADFPEPHAFHGAIDDDFSCTACNCASPEESGCSIFIGLYRDSFCVVGQGGSIVPFERTGCMSSDIPERYASVWAHINSGEPSACIADGGALVGQAAPALTSTFCCQSL